MPSTLGPLRTQIPSGSGRPRPAVLKYYCYQAASSVGFTWPILTLFLLHRGLTFTRIGTLSAVSALLVVVLEVPTGALADRIGRRNVLAVGMAAMGLSHAGFVVAETFPAFAALYAVWAVGLACRSGIADAWLYETLRDALDADAFTRVRGRGGAVYQWTSAVTMIVGGALYVADPTYPFLAAALLNVVGLAAARSLPRNGRYADGEAVDRDVDSNVDPGAADRDDPEAADRDDPETADRDVDPSVADDTGPSVADDAVGVRESLATLRSAASDPTLCAYVAYAALFFAVVGTVDTYIQPIAVDAFGGDTPIGTLLGPLPEEVALGVTYAGFAAVAAVASDAAAGVRARIGLRRAVLLVPVAVAATLLVPAASLALAVPAFFVLKAGGELARPLVNQFVNDRTGSMGRATVLSATSMAYAFVRAPLKPLAGYVADLTAPTIAVAALGGGFLIVGTVVVAAVPAARAEIRTTTVEE